MSNGAALEFKAWFPGWGQLTPLQQGELLEATDTRRLKKGTVIQRSSGECTGLLLIRSGQLRAYLLSEEGREITLYRLFDRDLCLFTASCMLQSIQFDITVEAEKDTEIFLIRADVARRIMDQSAPMANVINEVMASRFSEVMWLMEQILWKSFDRRLAEFLLQEETVEESGTLELTHETIGKHLGTAREVVTRMLRYFQNEGMVKLSRGTVTITDEKKLRQLLKTN